MPDPGSYHQTGETVSLYLRPEDIGVSLFPPGSAPVLPVLEGKVTSSTFLGPVTRLGLATEIGPVTAVVSSTFAPQLSIDSSVAAELDSRALRLLGS